MPSAGSSLAFRTCSSKPSPAERCSHGGGSGLLHMDSPRLGRTPRVSSCASAVRVPRLRVSADGLEYSRASDDMVRCVLAARATRTVLEFYEPNDAAALPAPH